MDFLTNMGKQAKKGVTSLFKGDDEKEKTVAPVPMASDPTGMPAPVAGPVPSGGRRRRRTIRSGRKGKKSAKRTMHRGRKGKKSAKRGKKAKKSAKRGKTYRRRR